MVFINTKALTQQFKYCDGKWYMRLFLDRHIDNGVVIPKGWSQWFLFENVAFIEKGIQEGVICPYVEYAKERKVNPSPEYVIEWDGNCPTLKHIKDGV